MSVGKWQRVRRHLSTFFMAFVLAVAVWISAVLASDPNQVGPLPYRVPVEVRGLGQALLVTQGVPESVEVTVRAPQSLWSRLNAERDLVRAWLDLTDLTPGTYRVPVQVGVLARPVQVVQWAPQEAEVTIERLAERVLPVTVEHRGEVALGYYAGEPLVSPAQVRVSGPSTLVEQVARVAVTVDLANARETVRRTLRPLAYDEKGRPLSGLTLEPETVEVTVSVRQLGGYRDVAVKVVLEGQVANGYRITNVSVAPPVVTVFSQDPELVRALPGFVETEPLDISGATDDVEGHLALILPDGVELVGLESVLVQVSIAAIEGSLTLTVPIEAVGLTPGLTAQIAPEEVDVLLSGPLPVLDALKPDAIRVTVDLSALEPGTYQLTPQVEVLVEGVRVDAVNPSTVEVSIQPGATPSPTLAP